MSPKKNSPSLKPISRQRRWQLKQKAKGNCTNCGNPRDSNLTMRCRICQDIWNSYQREGAEKDKA